MEISVVTAIVGSASALLGAGLGAAIQWRLAKASQSFQLRLEMDKRESDIEERERNEQRQRLLDAHKAISMVARQFSITAFDIAWRSGMTDKEYDKNYLEACEALDEARAVCDLFFPEVSEPLEKIYDHMNVFWGNFKEVLRLTELKESYEKKQHFHAQAIAAAQDIGASSRATKARLGKLIEQYRLRVRPI